MGRSWSKFVLLLWKNWLLQKRLRRQTIIEVLVPVILSALLVVIRSLVEVDVIDAPTFYEPFSPVHFPLHNYSIPPNLNIPTISNDTIIPPEIDKKICRYLTTGETPSVPYNKGEELFYKGFRWNSPAPKKPSERLQRIHAFLQANYLQQWIVVYSPQPEFLNGFINDARAQVIPFIGCGIDNATALQDFMTSPGVIGADPRQIVLAGIVFDDSLSDKDDFPSDVNVKIRFPGERRVSDLNFSVPVESQGSQFDTLNWQTGLLFPLYQMPGPRNDQENDGGSGYYKEGFLALQTAIGQTLLQRRGVSPVNISLQRFPYPPYVSDPLLQAMEGMVSLIIELSFIYSVISSVRMVTTEKEKQLKETMKLMGLPNWLHWSAWFVKSVTFFTISVALITALLCAPIAGADKSVLAKSDWSCILAFLFCYIVSASTFAFAISSFFSRANTAALVSGLIWLLTYFPYMFLQDQYETTSLSTKLGISLFVNTAMAYGFQIILMFEGTGSGLQWSNLWSPVTPTDTLTMGHVMGFLLIDAIIYMVITVYVEGVYPGEYGVPLPWYFPLTKTYWFGEEVNMNDESAMWTEEGHGVMEPDPKNLVAGVRINNLKKVYRNGKTAVEGLTINLYEGQITVLLGHNGAGKTTTMSMLTGMYTPTSGTATINGHDIRTDMNGARENLGLCPQHNILFDDLTVKEHLDFYGKLKGLSGKALSEETERFISVLELENKTDAPSSSLSGGMKRKLGAAIALCGGSKVVLFDEPTSGMDPAARRALWDLLQSEREGRTILLTTHFMDEADILGDRIAIMSEGRLKAVGSPFFLKKKFGGGYHLVLVKKEGCIPSEVTNFFSHFIPNIQPSSNIGTELSYHLDDSTQSLFQQIFSQLEQQKELLGISSYGVSLTTMEEVFMKVGSDHEVGKNEENAQLMINGESSDTLYVNHDTALTLERNIRMKNPQLLLNQTHAMIIKNVTSTWRNWLLYLIILLIPFIDLTISILIGKTFDRNADLPARAFSLTDYHGGVVTTEELAGADTALVAAYKKLITLDEGRIIDITDTSPNLSIEDFILEESTKSLGVVTQTYLLATSFSGSSITAYFNNQPLHVAPLALSYVYNALLQAYVSPESSLTIVNYPLPFTAETKITVSQQGGTMGFQVALNIGISFAFVSSYFAVFYIRERVAKAKHLQFVSGVNIPTFWSVAFLWDIISSIGPILVVVLTLLAFNVDGFNHATDLGRVFAVLICSMFAILPMSYLVSFWFEIAATGFARIVLIHIFTGVAAFIIVLVIRTPSLDLLDTANTLDWIFTFLPIYSLTSSMQNLNANYMVLKACAPLSTLCDFYPNPCCKDYCGETRSCVQYQYDYFAWEQPGVGRNIAFFFIVGAVLITLLMLKENRIWEMLKYKGKNKVSTATDDEPTDADVQTENLRVASINEHLRKEHNLLIQGVSKYYGSFRAVKNLNIAVKHGECFGLLGVNGAGKTTTFKMLTGDEIISSGDAFVQGLSLKYSIKKAYQLMGYCPQFDALLDDLTGRETLKIFCLLRGVPNHEISGIIERLAKELLFTAHIDKKVKEYSGGNKRKLSTAVALVGDPPVVYLDEPTTGMDPVAKRHLWDVICKIRDSGKTIVLTSHSMEECEALCTRLAIMVNGEFVCLGSTQHLKNKFAEDYTLIVKVHKRRTRTSAAHNSGRSASSAVRPSLRRMNSEPSEVDLRPIKNFIEINFPGAKQREEYQGLITYQIPKGNLSWATMFGLMESSKGQLNIEDYSLGQTSLEQVFLSFTKYQENRNNSE